MDLQGTTTAVVAYGGPNWKKSGGLIGLRPEAFYIRPVNTCEGETGFSFAFVNKSNDTTYLRLDQYVLRKNDGGLFMSSGDGQTALPPEIPYLLENSDKFIVSIDAKECGIFRYDVPLTNVQNAIFEVMKQVEFVTE